MSRPTNKRKTSVANARIQYTLAFRVVTHFFIFICAGAIFGIINQFLLDPFGGVRENLATWLRSAVPFLLALICMMPIFVLDTLKLSNRIVGPIWNLRNTVRSLAAGEPNTRPLRFRKGDFWEDLPESFNQMTDRLRKEGAAHQLAETVAVDNATITGPSSTDAQSASC